MTFPKTGNRQTERKLQGRQLTQSGTVRVGEGGGKREREGMDRNRERVRKRERNREMKHRKR